jgi:hypothetical protein
MLAFEMSLQKLCRAAAKACFPERRIQAMMRSMKWRTEKMCNEKHFYTVHQPVRAAKKAGAQ